MPGRQYSNGSYRYGFNGKENDNDVKGKENQLDYGMRIYDPRLGKFLSVDPLVRKYPELTPYQFASNTPIQAIDLDGAESMFGWSIGLTPEQTSQAADSWNKNNVALVNGTISGVGKALGKAWSFVSSDAWKASTWGNLATFMEEGALDMSSVKIAPSPNIDAIANDFKENVINGSTYSRSEYIAEFGTSILLAKGAERALTISKTMILAEKISIRSKFASAFYKNAGGNVAEAGGINFTKSVTTISLNDKVLYQWTIEGKLGDYFTLSKDAKNVGIPQLADGTPAYFDQSTNSLKARTLVEVKVPGDVEAKGLKSTATDMAPWDGASGMNKGGDVQVYAPEVKKANPTVTKIQ